MSASDKFHEHLDDCRQCRENPFSLCDKGVELIEKAATSLEPELRGLMQWNRVLRNASGAA